MKQAFRVLLAAALLGASSAAIAATEDKAADPAFVNETPLMVIRFNQPRVDYPMPLYNTVGQAFKVKPSAVFDLVSIAPRAHDTHNQAYYNKMAAQNSHKVLATLHEIGVPANRISMTDAIDDVSASEVRIFVH